MDLICQTAAMELLRAVHQYVCMCVLQLAQMNV